jgi:uncharacterized membrane protein YkvA (DUF1232 family)
VNRKLKKLKAVINNIKTAGKYIADPEVSSFNKILLVFPLVYIISPVDLLPDVIPLLGWADDTAIALVIWNYVINNIQNYKLNQNQNEETEPDKEDSKADYTLEDDEYDVN